MSISKVRRVNIERMRVGALVPVLAQAAALLVLKDRFELGNRKDIVLKVC